MFVEGHQPQPVTAAHDAHVPWLLHEGGGGVVDCTSTGAAVVNEPAKQVRVREPLCNVHPLSTVYVQELPLARSAPGAPQPPFAVPAGSAGIVHESGTQVG